MILRCFLLLIAVTLFWENTSHAGTAQDIETKIIQKTLIDINRINQGNESCNDPQCKFINDLTKEDSIKILTGVRLRNEICDEQMRREIVDDGKNSADNFAKAYPGVGAFGVSQASRCSKGDQWEQKQNLSKYYYFADRIYETEKINLMQMAMNDRILGKNILDGVDCGIFTYEANRKQCENLRGSCQPKAKLDKLVEETAQVETELRDIREEVKKLDSTMQVKRSLLAEIRRYNYYENNTNKRLESEIATLKEQIAQRQALISLRIQKYPWVVGQKFNDLKPTKLDWPASADQISKIKAAMTQQLEFDREGMIKKENSLSEQAKCLNNVTECSTTDFIEKAQKLESFLPSQNSSVNGLMQAQACYTSTKTQQLKDAQAVRHTVVDLSLMAAGSIGIWSKVFRGSSLLIRGVQLSAESAVTASAFGTAVYYSSESVPEALMCAEPKEVMRKKSKVLETDFTKICDDKAQLDYEETYDQYASCMQKRIFAAMDALPIAIGTKSLQSILRKFKEGRSEEKVGAYQVGRMQEVVGAQQRDLEKIKSVNSALNSHLVSEQKRKGLPADKVYLKLTDKSQLRTYVVKGENGAPDTTVMRLEEKEDLGIHDRGSLDDFKKTYGETTLIIEPVAGAPGKMKVSHWATSKEIPVDPTTGVIAAAKDQPGRQILQQVVGNCSKEKDCKQSLIFIDINNLGTANFFNEGMAGGDFYLQKAILETQKQLRGPTKDRPSGDSIFRIAGDEFVVVVDAKSPQDLNKIITRIEESVNKNPELQNFFKAQSQRNIEFKNKLSATQSWQDIGSHIRVREFVINTKAWKALNADDRKEIITNPEKYQSFISNLLVSPEMVTKQQKIDLLQPGATVGSSPISYGSDYDSIYSMAEREMRLNKIMKKKQQRENLPDNDKSIEKQDVEVPEWGD